MKFEIMDNWLPENLHGKPLVCALYQILSHPIRSYKDIKEEREEKKKDICIKLILKNLSINSPYSYNGGALRGFYTYYLKTNTQEQLEKFFEEKILKIWNNLFKTPQNFFIRSEDNNSICIRRDTFQILIDEMFLDSIISDDFNINCEKCDYLQTIGNLIRSAFNSVLKDFNYMKLMDGIAPDYHQRHESDYRYDRQIQFDIINFINKDPRKKRLFELYDYIKLNSEKSFKYLIIKCLEIIYSDQNKYFDFNSVGSSSYIKNDQIEKLIKEIFENNLLDHGVIIDSDIIMLKDLLLYLIDHSQEYMEPKNEGLKIDCKNISHRNIVMGGEDCVVCKLSGGEISDDDMERLQNILNELLCLYDRKNLANN